MRSATRTLGAIAGAVLLTGCSLFARPLLPVVPVEGSAFAPVLPAASASVGRVLGTSCAGRPLSGSGFVVGERLVLTAAHVVAGAHQVSLRLSGRAPVLADVVGLDAARDTALLRTAAVLPVAPLVLAGPAVAAPGTEVATLGLPLGESEPGVALTRITSVTDRAVVNDHPLRDLVTVDTTLAPGSSGGPAIAPDGRVLGMVVATIGGRGGRDSAATVTLAIDTASLAQSVAQWSSQAPLPVAPCDGDRPAPGPGPAIVLADGAVPEPAHSLWLYGESVSSGRLGAAWGLLTPAAQAREGGRERWAAANSAVAWQRLEVASSLRDGDTATVRARLRSAGPGACAEAEAAYRLALVGGVWLLESTSPTGTPTPCG
ncbi:hypothetical protein PROP_00610 [Propionicimonas sp. T2.31MG-18]|uniref:trypsin-like peptidase domain-containing protein n=1 Tax=Propionicimonas sp. T2.31MG-18 TaxID=3157620 RepID=UPI0035ECC28B